jgi:hypothetical protein
MVGVKLGYTHNLKAIQESLGHTDWLCVLEEGEISVSEHLVSSKGLAAEWADGHSESIWPWA